MKFAKTRVAVALLAVTGLALAGCASGARGGSSGEGKVDDSKLEQTTPAAKSDIDKVTWNSTYGELATLDPVKAFNYPENTIIANLCESLFQMQPDFSIKPNLAKSSKVSDGGKTYTFELRDDVKFWDGSPMTTEDVLFSLKRHLDPNEGSYLASSFDKVTSIEKTGDHEITLKLKEPNTILDEDLSTNLGAVVQEKQRKAAGANYGNPDTGIMCTGPMSYTPGDWKQGQSITLKRFDGYWNADKKAKAKEVEIGFVVDPTAIATGLKSGDIQGSYDVPLPALGELSGSTTGSLIYGQGMQIMAIISTGNGTFGDPAVRRALTRATDRQAIADTVYEGTATPSRSIVPQGPWNRYPGVAKLRDEKLPDLSYDIEAAKKELKDAKVDLTKPIKIAYPSERSFYADILNEMANGAKKLGLTLQPTGVPSAQFGAFFSDPKARAGYDGFVTTNYLSSPSPLNHLENVAYTGSQQNYSGFSDPAVDQAIDKAKAETDPEKRAELTVDAEALVMQQQPWVPIDDLAVRMYLNKKVTGAPASFVYLYYPWAADLGSAE
ncbi:ABC transporter substrate-binding protein [Leucobacter iarius]|uniref:ABC transporter substrate-binding protein n=1 Tax=Leucobacter iarius TaxID=333963 RepID=A0ABP4XFL8_9MICO